MPVYEYECTCCPCRFELKRSFNENTPVCCPQCGGKAQRIFSPVPIIFKGTGFYSTDHRPSRHEPELPGADAEKRDKTDETEAGSTEKGV